MPERVICKEFPDYEIAEDGAIYSLGTGRQVKPSRNTRGQSKITLYHDGDPYTRSVALLVAQAHVWNQYDPELFDTPVHLDCNPHNNHKDNLVWRPRWFALKYHRQYWDLDYRHTTAKVMDDRGEIHHAFELCQKEGYLFMDLIQSTIHGTPVFPTRRLYTNVT